MQNSLLKLNTTYICIYICIATCKLIIIIKVHGYCNNFVANSLQCTMYIGQTYNCSDAAKLLKSKFALLSNLSYPNMSGSLYANNVITQQEKLEIDRLVGKSQMERVLDIVIASLKANQTAKYKGFLLTMESNEDGTLNAKAQELGEWILSELHITHMHTLACLYIQIYNGVIKY